MTEPEENQTSVENGPTESGGLVRQQSGALATLERLAAIPEEELWLQNQRSAHTRRAYKEDVRHFMQMFGITTHEDLRATNRAAVIAWTRKSHACSRDSLSLQVPTGDYSQSFEEDILGGIDVPVISRPSGPPQIR